jgi:hypothetical protein
MFAPTAIHLSPRSGNWYHTLPRSSVPYFSLCTPRFCHGVTLYQHHFDRAYSLSLNLLFLAVVLTLLV